MACYRNIGDPSSAVADVAWEDGAVWVHSHVGGVASAPVLRRYDVSNFTLLDTHTPIPTSSEYTTVDPFTADNAGNLYWAERLSTGAVSPVGTFAIAVYKYDISANTTTQLLTITAPDAVGTPSRMNQHRVSGLEWREADNLLYLAWNYTRASNQTWNIDHFAIDGTGLTTLLSGTSTFPDVFGPLVFDPDEISMWCRHRFGVANFRIGHVDLTGPTVSSDPTSGDSDNRMPGIPTATGLTYTPSAGGAWKQVTFDNPGFTVSAAPCTDTEVFADVAYEQGTPPWSGLAAFIDQTSTRSLWVPAVGGWTVGRVAWGATGSWR